MGRSDSESTFSGLRIRMSGKVASYVFVAVIGGGGGSVVMDFINPPRPNPYTSKDGIRDRTETLRLHDIQRQALLSVDSRLDAAEREISSIRGELAHVHERLDDHLRKKRPH